MGVFQDARIRIAGLCLTGAAIGFTAGREYEAEKVAKTEAAQRLGRDKQMENFLKDEGVALKLANNELRLLEQRKTELPQGIQNLLTDMRFDVDDLTKRHGFASEALKESGAAAATSATSKREGSWYRDLVEYSDAIDDSTLKQKVTIFTLT